MMITANKIPFLLVTFLFPFVVYAQRDTLAALKTVKAALEDGKKNISDILSDSSFDFIRSHALFREEIKRNAKNNKVKITTAYEPGAKILVKGKLLDAMGNPLGHSLVYVYHTDNRGWYGSDRTHFIVMEGDRKYARLFAYLVTGDDGTFEIQTIQPRGYPQSDLPAHIHIEVFNPANKALVISELLFDDDERLTAPARARATNEGFLIAKEQAGSKNKIYAYTIQIKK